MILEPLKTQSIFKRLSIRVWWCCHQTPSFSPRRYYASTTYIQHSALIDLIQLRTYLLSFTLLVLGSIQSIMVHRMRRMILGPLLLPQSPAWATTPIPASSPKDSADETRASSSARREYAPAADETQLPLLARIRAAPMHDESRPIPGAMSSGSRSAAGVDEGQISSLPLDHQSSSEDFLQTGERHLNTRKHRARAKMRNKLHQAPTPTTSHQSRTEMNYLMKLVVWCAGAIGAGLFVGIAIVFWWKYAMGGFGGPGGKNHDNLLDSDFRDSFKERPGGQSRVKSTFIRPRSEQSRTGHVGGGAEEAELRRQEEEIRQDNAAKKMRILEQNRGW